MPSRKKKINGEDNQAPLFYDSVNHIDLPDNFSLPAPEIIKHTLSPKTLKIYIVIPPAKGFLNLYLMINGIKTDMMHQVQSGKYNFIIKKPEKDALIELYYICCGARSRKAALFI
jgi:hypothetical protein